MNDKICGYYLDEQQQEIVLDESKYLLVVAGAGSGKTLTILGKLNYLIKYKGILPSDILCISFTRASSDSLKQKILKEFNLSMPVYTFHKLSLEILKESNYHYEISSSDILDNIVHDFFCLKVLDNDIHMRMILSYFNIRCSSNVKRKYLNFYNRNYPKIELLERLLVTFLHLFKCNNYSLEYFTVFLKKSKKKIFNFNYKKEKIFLTLALNIYLFYQEYLDDNNEIDFDDMIIKATKQVQDFGIKKKYKYVIIDEYQDTSYIRFCLIKSILDYADSKLMVVGDDFQSIYRFTGCDISLFLNFKKYFKDAKIKRIENTYRNSQELVTIASDFVMRNKYQIKKDLKSNKHLDYPIKIVYYKDIKQKFLELVINIYKETNKPILILGRNNRDIFMVLGDNFKLKENGKVICLLDENIELYYLTIHKSKGLEEENVVIINLENKLLGFPSGLREDRILRFVSNNFESFPYGEERRLFYVALTRTKNNVYLLAPFINRSIFVDELLRYNRRDLEIY